MKKLFLILFTLLIASPALAGQVTLQWDANAEPVSGYRIYAALVGEPYDYTSPLYDGTATSATIEIANAAEYKFVARAYLVGDSGAVYESGDSNEVKHAIVVWANPNLRVK
jgi:hypothetical protein